MGWLDVKSRLPFRRGAGREPAASGVITATSSPEPNSPGREGEEKPADVGVDELTEQPLQAGELSLEEAAHGGMGRHLGLISTTFLMYVQYLPTYLPHGAFSPRVAVSGQADPALGIYLPDSGADSFLFSVCA